MTILLISQYFLFGQDDPLARKNIEIYMITKNISTKSIFYKMESLKNFIYENDISRWSFSTSNNSKWVSSTLPLDAPNTLIDNDTETGNTNSPWLWRVFDFVSGSEEHDPEQPDFAYGIYRLTCFEVDDDDHILELPGSFYLDYRDNYYPGADPPGPDLEPYSLAGADADIFIKYDVVEGRFYYTHDEAYANNTTGIWSNTINKFNLATI